LLWPKWPVVYWDGLIHAVWTFHYTSLCI